MNETNNTSSINFLLPGQGGAAFEVVMKFLPLLLIYVIVVITASSSILQGDEGRYVMFATNLSNGHYSPQDQIYLWNGPGYPIVLLPFVLLDLPWIAAKMLNPFFLFIAVIYFHYTLRSYMKERAAMFFSYVFGLYYPFWRHLHLLLTEQLAVLLVCGFIFHFSRLYNSRKTYWPHILSASFYLGFLALTKIFFGYVILTGLILSFILYIALRRNKIKTTFMVYALAFVLCVPYLSYTYSLTGKVFYWGNSGGLSLYLMSSPYENEFGDWASRNSLHHQDDYSKLQGLSNIERDIAFKKLAFENIKAHPLKYVRNLAANIGRLWFNYPFSYRYQQLSNYFYIVPNMFILVFSITAFYPALLRWRLFPYELKALILFAIISFGGMCPLDGEVRYLWPLIPFIILWISFVMVRILKIEIKDDRST